MRIFTNLCLISTAFLFWNSPPSFSKSPAVVSINGTVSRPGGFAVSGIPMMLTGSASANQNTNVSGQYAFTGLPDGGSFTVTPGSPTTECFSSCLDVFDYYLIQRHILGLAPLGSPYAILAADINNSGTITSLDLVQLRQLLLGTNSGFSNNTCWRFVDANYVFPNPSNPFSETVPASVSFNNLNANAQADFIAIRVGDVSGCTETLTPSDLTLIADFDADVCPGQDIVVPILVQDFSGIAGLQFTLQWDPLVLNYQGVLNFGLPGLGALNFGETTNNTASGILPVVWATTDGGGIAIPDGSLIANVYFEVIGNPGAHSAIHFSQAPLAPQAVSGQSTSLTINTVDGNVEATGPSLIMGPVYCYNGNQFISFYAEGPISGADSDNVYFSLGNDGYWSYNLPDNGFWYIDVNDGAQPPCFVRSLGNVGVCSDALTPDCSSPVQLTDNTVDDDQPSIYDHWMVWQHFDGADYEIYLLDLAYPGQPAQPLTNNTTDDLHPSISGNRIVWEHHAGSDIEIHALSLDNLSANPDNLSGDLSNGDFNPKIWGNYVVWHKGDDLYYYDFSTRTPTLLAHTGSGSSRLDMWGNKVVWESQTGGDNEIYAADLSTYPVSIFQLSSNAYEDSQPQLYGDYVVWVGYPGVEGDIFGYELGVSSVPALLSPASSFDNAVDLYGNYAVWSGSDGSDYEIFRYDMSQLGSAIAEPLTDNTTADYSPAIWGNHVVWNADGENYYLPVTSPGQPPFHLTKNSPLYAEPPRIYGQMVFWRGFDGDPELMFYDLTLLPPAAPVLDAQASVFNGLCSGDQATLVLESIGAGYAAVWFADEQMMTQLYDDAANLFQTTINTPTTLYAAWRNPISGCIGDLTPVMVNPAATDNLACNDQLAVALDLQCQAEMTVTQILEGNYGCLGQADFNITVNDGNPGNGGIVDGPGTFPCVISLAPGIVGNFTSCFSILTVIDNLPPSITCPPDQSVQAMPGDLDAPVSWPDPIALDNCNSILSSTHNPGDLFPVGQTTVSYNITDDSGNAADCSFLVQVQQAQAAVTLQAGSGTTQTGSIICIPITVAGFEDVVGMQFSIQYDPAFVQLNSIGNFGLPGLDASGFGTIPPDIITVSWTDPNATGVTLPDGSVLFELCFDALMMGITPVIITSSPVPIEISTDPGGVATVNIINGQITISDPPFVLICPGDIIVNNDPGQCGALVNIPAIQPSEPGTLTNDFNGTADASGFYPVGVTSVTYTFVSDLTGQTSNCTFTVTVFDVEPPAVQCPPDIAVTANPGETGANVIFGAFQLSDNCPETILSCSGMTGDFFPCGETVVTCSATDASNNMSAPCSFTINVACPMEDGCSALGLSLTPEIQDSTGDCCRVMNYENTGTETVYGVQLISLDGVTMHSSLAPGYFTPIQNDSNLLITTAPIGPLPAQVNGLIDLCLEHILATPQYVVVNYLDADFEIICSDTLSFTCPVERTCLYIVSDSLICDTAGYKFIATVANPPDGFPVGLIKFNVYNAPVGVSFTPSPIEFDLTADTLHPGEQTMVMFNINTTSDLFGDSLCFVLSAHDGPEERLCCAEIDTCIAFPLCDPCPFLSADIEPVDSVQANECCFSFYYTDTLSNPGLATGLQVSILNPGFTFSGIEALEALLNGWIQTPALPGNSVTWMHSGGALPTGVNNYLFDFCVQGTTSTDSIYIQINWLGSINQDTICTDTLAVFCPSCLAVVNDRVICVPDSSGGYDYQYMFQIENYSAFVVNAIAIVEDPSTDNFISPELINIPPLPSYDPGPPANVAVSAPVSIIIDGAVGAQENYCFDLVLRQIVGDSIDITCCYVRHCIDLPPCDSISSCADLICIPPADDQADCSTLPGDFDPNNTAHLQTLFGSAQAGGDCPGASWQELAPTVNLIDCMGGTIVRNFVAYDALGIPSTNVCQQTVTINVGPPAYTIPFPADIITDCEGFASLTIDVGGGACDFIAVSFEDEILIPQVGECFKVSRRWRVTNWCEYDGISGPVIVSRDEDCNGIQGDQDLWVLVRPSGIVYYDQDNDETNGTPAAGIRSTGCDGLTNPAGHWLNSVIKPAIASTGYWEYTQTIRVIDNTPPVITTTPVSSFCTNDNTDCTGPVTIPFAITEACNLSPVIVQALLDLDNNTTIDAGVQLEASGTLTTLSGVPGFVTISNLGGGNYTVNASAIPVGTHQLILQAIDPCGNTGSTTLIFNVVDCLPPSPVICINGIVGTLSGFIDTDGDGTPDAPGIVLDPSIFLDAMASDCSPPVIYSINKVGTTPDPGQTTLIVTCSDLGVVDFEIHAWDAAGNQDYCVTFFLLQDPLDLCSPAPPGVAADSPIRLFPNPTSGEIWLLLPPGEWSELRVLTPEGSTLQSRRPNRDRFQKIDAQLLPPGLYFVRLQDDTGGTRLARFVRQ